MAKRGQLAVGQEWAYQRSRSHQHTSWGSHYKVVIESVEPHEQSRFGIHKRSSGLGVLVSVHEKYQGQPKVFQKVVQLSQLWKPWAEYEVEHAEYKAQYQIAQEEAKVAKAKREKFQEEIYRPALKEFLKAIEPFNGGKYISGWTKIEELPVEVLQKVTEAIKEKAVA